LGDEVGVRRSSDWDRASFGKGRGPNCFVGEIGGDNPAAFENGFLVLGTRRNIFLFDFRLLVVCY
jgi:hypothetical protein